MLLLAPAVQSRGAEITPFYTSNQSPLVQIYGLPAPGRARLLEPGEVEVRVTSDWSNNFSHGATGKESIMLDGEAIRGTIAVTRGFAEGLEAGLELPVIHQSGGILDGFIEGWHDFFHLPGGTRSEEPRNRMLYRYDRDGKTRLQVTGSHTGIGDLRLTGGTPLYRSDDRAVALRGLVKFPTGDSSSLSGSGSTDFALWLTATNDYQMGTWGKGSIFGALGGMAMTKGDVIGSQHRPVVGFGSLGAGWSPYETVAFKLQLSTHTPFYRDSDFNELNGMSAILILGGTIAFTDKTALDVGVSEDVIVDSAPDVSFHLSLSTKF